MITQFALTTPNLVYFATFGHNARRNADELANREPEQREMILQVGRVRGGVVQSCAKGHSAKQGNYANKNSNPQVTELHLSSKFKQFEN